LNDFSFNFFVFTNLKIENPVIISQQKYILSLYNESFYKNKFNFYF